MWPCDVCVVGCKLQAEFEQITTLSEQLHQEQRQYDAATCMFAIHYFFDKEESLDYLLETIAANLKPGALTAGVFAQGCAVIRQTC
jgi:ubiquinone/menaquinone biosynthesis C-methylase UbiE